MELDPSGEPNETGFEALQAQLPSTSPDIKLTSDAARATESDVYAYPSMNKEFTPEQSWNGQPNPSD